MYEMEGALPGHVVASQPAAWPPKPAGHPLLPCTRGRFRFPGPCRVPGVTPGAVPVSQTVRVFLHAPAGAAQGAKANSCGFFSVHIFSTGRAGLSAVIGGYPLRYAQPFHRSPVVTRGIPAGPVSHRGHQSGRQPLRGHEVAVRVHPDVGAAGRARPRLLLKPHSDLPPDRCLTTPRRLTK